MVAPAVTPEPEAVPDAPARRTRRLRPVLLRVLVAAVSGLLLYASFPPRTVWWLAPVAFALFAATLHGRRARAGLGYGFVFGLAFLLPLLHWLQDFLGDGFGPTPWLALTTTMALMIAVPAAGMAVVSTLPGGPVWMAALYVAGEAVRARFPFGGFPWARVGFGQPEGLFLPLASLGGVALVGFAVVFTGCAITALAVRVRVRRTPKTLAVPVVVALAPVLLGAATLPLVSTAAQDGTITVAVVQGNSSSEGLTMLGGGDDLRRNHLARAEQLADDIRAGRVARPDVVIMPETFTGVGPAPSADRQLARVVEDLGVPTLVGAAQLRADRTRQNVVIDWDPRTGPGQTYAKQQLVPFGEFVPLRPVARWFTPFVDDQVDMVPGTQPPVLPVAGTRIGVAICFEVAYDHVLDDAVRDGAEILTVPTNNAWFGRSEMSYQQLAMSRLRAVEHGRAVVVSATTGVSAIVEPDGTVIRQTGLFTADTLVATVPKRSTVTLATRLGAWPEAVLAVGGVLALVTAVGTRLRRRHVLPGRGDRVVTDDRHDD